MTKRVLDLKNLNNKHYIIAIVAIFIALFSYTFNAKLDMNGDNCFYYSYATSIAEGSGYCDVSHPDIKPSSTFPFGYPLLMSPLRLVTDSIIAQKILNGIFLFISAILLFLVSNSILKNRNLAFTLSLVSLINYRVLEFTTMMMSEASFILFSLLIIYLLHLLSQRERVWWREPLFYILIVASGYSFEIRTQGITLICAVIVYFLFNKKWIIAGSYAAGTYLTTLPWVIRNSVQEVGKSRYLDQVFAVNPWRPEEGYHEFSAVISRAFDTLQMIVTKAIPNSVMPYLKVNYNEPSAGVEWIVGVLLVGLIVYGFLQFKRFAPLLISYSVFTVGIICLWSAPSGNRYLTTILPLFEVGLILGVYTLLKLKIKNFSPLWLLIPITLLVAPKLKQRNEIAKRDYPQNFKNFIELADKLKSANNEEIIVCSRKSNIFYVLSGLKGVNYRYTLDNKELIRGLLEDDVDYVILDQLGYSSTFRYLLPAVQNHPEIFKAIYKTSAPENYILQFDKAKAKELLGK